MKPVIIFDTGERFRPHLILNESGFLDFETFKPYYDGDEKVFYRKDPIKEQLLIDAITDRMAKIGVAPGDKSQTVSFNKSGLPSYYGKTVHYFINCTLRHAMCYSYSGVQLYPWDATFDALLYFIKYKVPDRSFLAKAEDWNSSEYILSVEKPIYRRATGNTNKNTFDFIDLLLVTRSNDCTKKRVLENKEEIFNKAIAAIERDRSFKKYGVPIGVLKMYQFSIKNNSLLTIHFCLKDEFVKGE